MIVTLDPPARCPLRLNPVALWPARALPGSRPGKKLHTARAAAHMDSRPSGQPRLRPGPWRERRRLRP